MTNLFKNHYAIVCTLLLGISMLMSCSKDDDTPAPKVYPEENPLTLYLSNSGFNQKATNFINSGTYEFGYSFKPKVKGKINAVTFRIPDNATNVKVTIWDAATKAPLRSVVIPNAVANTELRQAIEPLEISTDTEYLVSYNGRSWYKRQKTDGSIAAYPVEAGNILITGFRWGATTSADQKYPVTVSKDYYGGDLSIVFQQVD
ncbi:DUF4082 domain-containing protein [Parapedobacter defluvii]|nr:DUF4082 domain-containing protein [Parapedobacter defluvii]